MFRLSALRQKLSSNRSLIPLGIVVVCVNLILLTYDLPLGALDGRLYYSADDANALFTSLGPAGRQLYFQVEALDLLFISLYTYLLFRLYALSRRDPAPAARDRWFWILPAFFDLGETAGIMILLSRYPTTITPLAQWVSICSPLKWAALLLSILTLATRFARRLFCPPSL